MVICTQVKMLQQQVIKFCKLLAQSTSDSAVWIPPIDAMWKDMWYIVSIYIYIYIYIYIRAVASMRQDEAMASS